MNTLTPAQAPQWAVDKHKSDFYLPALKRILGEYLIAEPPVEEDQERNTDLIVLGMSALRVAARVRDYKYLSRYGNEFTIRSGRPSGVKTELTKIIEGWGDFLIYGFKHPDPAVPELSAWTLIDLRVFRLAYMRHMADFGGQQPGITKINHDGSSSFKVFNLGEFPPEMVVASSATVLGVVAA